MNFVGKVWKILVGIKDGLVLLFMLLFFVTLFAILSARPNPGQVRDGALLIDLDGIVVEEKSVLDPFETLLSGTAPVSEYRARDIVRALNAAATDTRIKAVVLDLTTFMGGGQVHLTEIGEAMDRVRKTKKPVLTYAVGYVDDSMLLAVHASEVDGSARAGGHFRAGGQQSLFCGPARKAQHQRPCLPRRHVQVGGGAIFAHGHVR